MKFAVVASLTSWHMHLILERSKARLASAPRTSKWYLRGVSSSSAWAKGVDDWMGVAPRRSSASATAVVSRLGASAAFSGRRGGGGGANEGNGDDRGACRCGVALGPGNAALTAAASAADVDSSRRSTCARCEVDARANRSIDAFPGSLAAGVVPGGVAPVGAGAWSSRAVLPLSRSDRRESMQRRGKRGMGRRGRSSRALLSRGCVSLGVGSCACAERAWKVPVAKTLVVVNNAF